MESTVISEIEAIKTKQSTARKREYGALVLTVADGKKVTGSHAAGVLEAVGKSTADLQADIDLLNKRRDLKAKLDALPGFEKELIDINAQLKLADDEINAAQQAYQEKISPFVNRRGLVQGGILAATAAVEKLEQTCPPELTGKIAEAVFNINENERGIIACKLALGRREEMEECERQYEAGKRGAGTPRENSRTEVNRHRASNLRNDIKSAEEALPDLEANVPVLNAKLAELKAQALEIQPTI